MDAFETTKIEGLTVKLYQDEDAESPRQWDNLGTMVCFHRDYILGDKHNFADGEALMQFLKDENPPVQLPLYLLDHSGLAMQTGTFACDPGDWDTSLVGVIYVTRERILNEYGKVDEETIASARRVLQGEVETFSQYLEGDVYGYVVEGPDGEDLDSCWGFFGIDYAREEVQRIAEYHAKELRKKHESTLKAKIRARAPLDKR